jgi:hypothetical protein
MPNCTIVAANRMQMSLILLILQTTEWWLLWNSSALEQFSSGTVPLWNSSALEQFRSGTVQLWNSSALEQFA